MKFGVRTPSIKKSISARTSIKRQVVHRAGLKMPKGYGAVRNPKKALYNKVYNKTTIKNPALGLAAAAIKEQKKNKSKEPIKHPVTPKEEKQVYPYGLLWFFTIATLPFFGIIMLPIAIHKHVKYKKSLSLNN